MSVPDLEPLRKSLHERLNQLDEKQEQQEERYQGNGSTRAVWKKVEPGIRHDIANDCLSDLKQIDDTNTLFETVAEWKRKLDDEWQHKTTDTQNEFDKKSIKQSELRNWIDELVSQIPDSRYEACYCGSQKEPVSDRRRSKGFEWNCPDCFR